MLFGTKAFFSRIFLLINLLNLILSPSLNVFLMIAKEDINFKPVENVLNSFNNYFIRFLLVFFNAFIAG